MGQFIKISFYFKFLGFFNKSKTYKKFEKNFEDTFKNLKIEDVEINYNNSNKFLEIKKEKNTPLKVSILIKYIANRFLKKFRNLINAGSVFKMYYRNFIGMNGKMIDSNDDIFNRLKINKKANNDKKIPHVVLNMDYDKKYKNDLKIYMFYDKKNTDNYLEVCLKGMSGEKTKKFIKNSSINSIKKSYRKYLKDLKNMEYFFVVDDKNNIIKGFFKKGYVLDGYAPCILPDGWSYVISNFILDKFNIKKLTVEENDIKENQPVTDNNDNKNIGVDSLSKYKKLKVVTKCITDIEYNYEEIENLEYDENTSTVDFIDDNFKKIIGYLKTKNVIKFLEKDEAINILKNESIINAVSADHSSYDDIIKDNLISVEPKDGCKLKNILFDIFGEKQKFKIVLICCNDSSYLNSSSNIYMYNSISVKIFIFAKNIEYIKKILINAYSNNNIIFKFFLDEVKNKEIIDKIYLIINENINEKSIDILKHFAEF